jgi:glucose-1-phosphate thymidylyltransferase
MTVIIPLAGYGIRLRPLSFSIPKPLLLCGGDTVLGWILESIKTLSPSEIVLVIGYKGDIIRDWVRERYGNLPVKWVVQEEAKGLGHAVWMAKGIVSSESEVLIYLGDSIFDLEQDIIKEGKDNFIGVREVEDPERFGIVKVKGDTIVDIEEKPEKPSSNLAAVGLYYIKKWELLYRHLDYLITEDIKTKGEYQLTDAFKLMMEKGDTELKKLTVARWHDCGNINSLLRTNAAILKDCPKWCKNKKQIKNFSYISDSSVLKNSNVGPFVTVGGNSLIEKSSIENSIIGNAAKIVNSDIFDSVIGDGVEIVNAKGKFIVGSNSLITGKECS